MIISNFYSKPHYYNVIRKYEYSRRLENELVEYLKKFFKKNNASGVISDFSPIMGFAMIEAAYQLNVPCTSYLPFMDFSITWNDELQERFNKLFEKTNVSYTNTGRYGEWKYRYNYERMVADSDLILLNKPNRSLDKNEYYILNRVHFYNKSCFNIYDDLNPKFKKYKSDYINYSLS